MQLGIGRLLIDRNPVFFAILRSYVIKDWHWLKKEFPRNFRRNLRCLLFSIRDYLKAQLWSTHIRWVSKEISKIIK